MDLIGYADRLSVAPGERIRFMVSARVPSYEAHLVRLARATPGPDGLLGTVVETPLSGTYNGREQPIHAGSYVLVDDQPLLHALGSFTVQAWIYPTLPRRSAAQGLITRWAQDGAGFGLVVDADGTLALHLGGPGGMASVRAGVPLRTKQWYAVAASYDAATGRVRLYQELVVRRPLDDARVTAEGSVTGRHAGGSAQLLIGANRYVAGPGHPYATGCFNGKIDRPRLFGRALNEGEIAALMAGAEPAEIGGRALLAAWDFAHDMSSARVHDTSLTRLHGRAVNTPMRAVTGYNWTGEVVVPAMAPEQYGALYFHEDDLEDAGWEADVALTVPEGLQSGVYAARLTAGDAREYIPFYVRPARGTAAAPIAFLAPTMTYLAYANERTHANPGVDFGAIKASDVKLEPADEYLIAHPELGLSVYDYHPDQTGICYSSWRRPVLNMRPGMRNFVNDALRHFGADLYLVEWLERQGVAYDVLTDHDLHAEGRPLLDRYRVVLTGSHPEYWTTPMLDALEGYLDTGGRLMYLGGNGFYWVTGVDPGRGHICEVRRGIAGSRSWQSAPGELYLSTTGELGGLWRYRGRAPQRVVGVGFASQGWGGATGYRRLPDSFDPRAAFIFAGIGAEEIIGDFGLVMGGAAGDEIDRADAGLGTPPQALVLATSTGHSDFYQFVQEDQLMTLPGQGGTQNPKVRADLVYFETPEGGAVFSVGSINWIGSLLYNDGDNNVSRLTGNVLRRFMERP